MAMISSLPKADPDATEEQDPTVLLNPPRVSATCGALTHQGRVRTNNEDQFLVARMVKAMRVEKSSLPGSAGTRYSDDDSYLMIVADGMGGAAAGERASALAVQSVEGFLLNTVEWFLHLGNGDENRLVAELRKGLRVADRALLDEAAEDRSLAGMGTTLTMAYSIGTDLYIVHAGDTRAYLFRDGQLEQITHDHTLVQLLVSAGMIDPAEARTHSKRNVVTNVLGGPNAGVHAEIHKLPLADGDRLLLCSDGLTEPLDDGMIADILQSHGDPDEACDALVRAALDHGGPDNVTAVLANYRIKVPR